MSTSATAAFGFESLANWTISSGTATLGAPRTQGQLALRLAKPVNHTTLTSRPLALTAADIAPLTQPGAFVAVDLALPTQQPNPQWFGTTQMYVNCTARGVHNQYLGNIELTGRRLGNFQTYRFAVTPSVRQALAGKDCSNFSVTLVLSVAASGTGTYGVDNLRFKSATDPSSTGNGSSVDLVALRGGNPVVSTPGSATFPEGRIQVPESFHVAQGSSGAGTLTLLLAASATDRTTCTYNAADAGTSYRFASCTRAEQAGDLVIASSATLTIVGSAAGDTKVKAQLAINPTGDELVTGLAPIPTFWGNTAAEVGTISGAYFQRVAQNPPGGVRVTPTSPALGKRDTVDPVRIRDLLDPNAPPLSPLDPPFNHYGDVGGNDLANAYWKLEGYLDGANLPNGSFSTTVRLDAHIHGVLLGFDQEVLRGRVEYDSNSGVITPTGRTGQSATGFAEVFAFGGSVHKESLDTSVTEKTLYTATTGINVPVISFGIFTVSVGVNATAKVDLMATAQVDGLSFTITPSANVGATLSGDVNILVASGGISASVSLIELKLPINAAASWGINTTPGICAAALGFNINSNLVVESGAGSIDAYVTFGNCSFFGLCHTESWNITRWNPLVEKTVPFINIVHDPLISLPFPPSFCDLPPGDVSIDCLGGNETVVVGLPIGLESSATAALHQTPCTGDPCLNIEKTLPCSKRTWTSSDSSDQFTLLEDDSADSVAHCPTVVTFNTPGVRTITLTAAEDQTPTVVTKTINVVTPFGTEPFVRMVRPAQGCGVSQLGGRPLVLLAGGVDPNGASISFEWDEGVAPSFTPLGSGPSLTWTNTPIQETDTNVRVTGTSSGGSTTISTPVHFNPPPT